MKNILNSLLISVFILSSCKTDKQTNTPVKSDINESKDIFYSVDAGNTEVLWTAYKTTAKTAVKGKFIQLKIDNPIQSDTKQGALSNLNFEIPVTSFFSSNEERDSKIKSLFFGVMKETSFLSGSFSDVNGNENSGSVTLNLKMNNETVPVPLSYTIDDRKILLEGDINLMDWKMDEAYNSIHKACEVLHTGPDGISKTWKEVKINAVAMLKTK